MTAAAQQPRRADNEQRVAVVFDGAHCDRMRKALDLRIQFGELLDHLVGQRQLAAAVYHRDVRDGAERKRLASFIQRLKTIGIQTCGASPEEMDPGRRERYGTNLVELAVDTLRSAAELDCAVLVAGDRKLRPLVVALQARGVHVVIATALLLPDAIVASDHLLDAADEVQDLTAFLTATFAQT